jgi:branched-chain amino acid transport system ATP-binding protein
VLEAHHLHASYGDLRVLSGVSLVVGAGEMVSLLGGNGSGKSTTLRTILGLVRPERGSVRFDGERIDGLPTAEVIRRGITMVPEGRRVFPWMTVRENLLLGAWVRRRRRADVARDLEGVMALFPVLRERLRQFGGTLSGGEQQMLAMARAIMLRPRLILMDEPSMGLAPAMVRRALEFIRTINAQGIAILLVEQNAKAALRMTHRAYVLEQGRVAIEGRSSDLLGDDRVRTAYLGELVGRRG